MQEISRQHPEIQVPPVLGQRLLLISYQQVAKGQLEPLVAKGKIPVLRARKKKPEELKPVATFDAVRAPTQAEFEALNLKEVPLEREEVRSPEIDASCCRALLLEVLRRAAYDWVLYRTSSKLPDKQLAEDAYYWIFVEDENCASWDERETPDENGITKIMTGFMTICDLLDLDPEKVRAYVRKLTIKNVMSVGRPAERRHGSSDESGGEEHAVHSVSVDSLPYFDPTFGSGG